MRKIVFLVACLLDLAAQAAETLPTKYVGVWSMPESVFVEGTLYGGTAVYLDVDGTGVVVGAPFPVRQCDGHPCAPIIAIRFHAVVGSDPNTLTVTISEYGPIRSGVGYTYDPVERSLIAQFGEKGKRLIRKSSDFSEYLKGAMHAPTPNPPVKGEAAQTPLPLP